MTIYEIAKRVEALAVHDECHLITALNDFDLTDTDYEAVAKTLGLWEEIQQAKRDAYLMQVDSITRAPEEY